MENLLECYSLTTVLFPRNTLKSAWRRARYALRLRFFADKLFTNVEYFFKETAVRRQIFSQPHFRKLIYKQQLRPWFYRDSKPKHRLYFLKSHFTYLEKTHSETVIRHIYASELPPINFEENGQKLSFRIGYHEDASKEGLAWFLVELNGEILYKIFFWFMEYEGVPTLCIGALQGGKLTLESNRIFTKEFFGLRPQNLALTVFRWYGSIMGAQQIFTFPKERMMCTKISESTPINEFWEEQGATAVEESPFIKIDLTTRYKALEEIPARKRSMYRKRYDFLERLEETMRREYKYYRKSS